MKTPDDFNVKSVYSYKSSEDLKRYYNDWAMGYDKYAQDVNYILADHIAKVSSTLIPDDIVSVLDIGCGTGIVGESLSAYSPQCLIDGVDISIEMINLAKSKKRADKLPCYYTLYCEDLTQKNKSIEKKYDFIVSAGTFTLGHLGVKELIESIDFLKNKGKAIFSIKADHYENDNFYMALQICLGKNIINNLKIDQINTYNSDFNALSKIVVFTKT